MSDYERRDQYPPAGPPVGGPPPTQPPGGSASIGPSGGMGGDGGGKVGRASVVSAVRAAPEKPKRRKKRMSKRRRRVYAALILVGLMLLGSGTVVGAAFFQSVPLPEELAYGESTSFTYADGETVVAGYGEFTRKLVDDYDDLPRTVIWSLLALEDRNYFEHEGVDYSGTMRALINNITGGDRQGASTISQQYAGMVADIRGDISYGRKAREAIMAMKMEQEYSKETILLHYLNLNFYNRGAYGIAAASEVWFGKQLKDLTWGEAMMLVMQVKAGDGSFDPRVVEEGDTAPLDRWTHGMEALLTLEDLTEEEKQLVQEQLDAGMPETREQLKNPGSWGHDTPTGFITNPVDGYVWDELESRYGLTMEDFYGHEEGTGGYTVVLTIDPALQEAAVTTASRGDLKRQQNEEGQWIDDDGNVVEVKANAAEYVNEAGFYEFENTNDQAALYDQNLSLASSLVAIDPATGAVVAYYGGDNGLGVDKAGEENPHPPSSTFKMVTAATAMTVGDASIDSWWDGSSPRQFESLEGQASEEITNHGTVDANNDVTLTTALRKSLNTPMYAIAEKYGATTVLATAVRMGLSQMTFNEGGNAVTYQFRVEDDGTISYSRHGVIQLEDGSYVVDGSGNIDYMAAMVPTIGEIAPTEDGKPAWATLDTSSPRAPADYQIGFGQYPTGVRDMAAVYATIANDGLYKETHFVKAVYDSDGNEVAPVRELHERQALTAEIARDLQWVGSEIDGSSERLSRDFTGKTGTWEAAGDYDGNAHTWYNGAIPQLSVASWVGNAYSESAPLLNEWGGTEGTYGATLSEPVWNQFMRAAIEVKGYEKESWGEPVHVGQMVVDDILNDDGTIDADSAFCAQYPTDTRCKKPDTGGPGGEECGPIEEWLGQCRNEENNGNGNGNGNGRGEDD